MTGPILPRVLLCVALLAATVHADDRKHLEAGARLFVERCSLCHGNDGMGEGILPLSLGDYPDTNLARPKFATTHQELRNAVFWGGMFTDMSELSPPWGDELSCEELDSVVRFIEVLRDDQSEALALLDGVEVATRPSAKLGKLVYEGRCALCHGASGEGDGKMSRIITSPPPFNLTRSVMPTAYLERIIGEGGAALGRSPQMPPWQDSLSDAELASVIAYLLELRNPATAGGAD